MWFDSASMPYAQVHYPFENHEWFDEHSPADFIVEYIGQTRGWFYVMHVLSTALFDRPAFTGVSCHGIVLGSDGLKMSKSLRNYPDVSRGVRPRRLRRDALVPHVARACCAAATSSSPRRGSAPACGSSCCPLWNAWYFFATYANAAGGPSDSADGGYEATWRTDSTDVLDRYILALTGDLVRGVAADLEGLDSTMAAAKLRDFAEALTNWYIRRSRDRFWVGVDPTTRRAARRSTRSTRCSRRSRASPRRSSRSSRSASGRASPAGAACTSRTGPTPTRSPRPTTSARRWTPSARSRRVANALRKKEGKRVRLPLARLTVVVPDAASLGQFEDILRDELNVKSVELVELDGDTAAALRHHATACRSTRARRARASASGAARHPGAKAGDWARVGRRVTSIADGRSRSSRASTSSSLETDRASPRAKALALLAERRLRAARHRRPRPSSRRRDSRATSSAPCRTPARRPASTSATASACSCSSRATKTRDAVAVGVRRRRMSRARRSRSSTRCS